MTWRPVQCLAVSRSIAQPQIATTTATKLPFGHFFVSISLSLSPSLSLPIHKYGNILFANRQMAPPSFSACLPMSSVVELMNSDRFSCKLATVEYEIERFEYFYINQNDKILWNYLLRSPPFLFFTCYARGSGFDPHHLQFFFSIVLIY